MKKLIVFSLVAALCLGLNGCKIVSQVSHLFAQVDDFIFMRDDAQAATNNQGSGNTVDPGPFSLILMSSGRVVKNIHIYSWTVNGQGVRDVDEYPPALNKDSQYTEAETPLPNGSYTLEFTAGQAGKNGGVSKWEAFNYTLQVNGHDLAYLVLVNVTTDETGNNVTAVDARLVQVTGSVVPPASAPTDDTGD